MDISRPALHRISVIGVSGAGKSTVARMAAARLGIPWVELDPIHHGPKHQAGIVEWQSRAHPQMARSRPPNPVGVENVPRAAGGASIPHGVPLGSAAVTA